jgi:hypothetical protein
MHDRCKSCRAWGVCQWRWNDAPRACNHGRTNAGEETTNEHVPGVLVRVGRGPTEPPGIRETNPDALAASPVYPYSANRCLSSRVLHVYTGGFHR